MTIQRLHNIIVKAVKALEEKELKQEAKELLLFFLAYQEGK